MLETEAPPTTAEAVWHDALIRRLVRLLILPSGPFYQPEIHCRAVFWAYTDCITAGLKPLADRAISIALGPREDRQPPERWTPVYPYVEESE